jgi:HK97 family phage major capsid protein
MPTLMERREKRANLFEQLKEINDRTEYDPQGQDLEHVNRIDADLDREDEIIERIENERGPRQGLQPGRPHRRRARRERRQPSGRAGRVPQRLVVDAAHRCPGHGPGERKILNAGRVNLPKNAAGVGTGSAGGYAVPPEFREQFIQTLKYYGPMLQEAEIIQTDSGASMPWPTNDDTGNVGAILAENTQCPSRTSPSARRRSTRTCTRRSWCGCRSS